MSDTLEKIKDLEINFKDELDALNKSLTDAKSVGEINQAFSKLKNKYIGKESEILETLKSIKDIQNPEEKKEVGSVANKIRTGIEEKLSSSEEYAKKGLLESKLKNEKIDPTHPGITPDIVGRQHILTQTIEEIEDIFQRMGFDVEYSYEVDNPSNAFDALNIPEDHPARDAWDTLWLDDKNLAIPHTSSMQHRILRDNDLPIRKAVIGKCFRNEATDASHEHTFTQCEGVYLDQKATMSEMLGVLVNFFENFFGQKLEYKFTPDFFPFVEPGGQLAIRFDKKKGDANATEIKSKFMEVLGCGMVHPEVIRKAGKDPSKVSGFAWGFGVERIAMIKHQISEIRYFHSGDIRFTRQFS